MSWNQWASAAPLPAATAPPQPPTAAPPALPAAPPANPSFNYAAMSVEQQYAIQQNWQQWQAYQQQYAQWHAQYGEQYQREMQAKLGSTAPQLPYSGTVSSVQVPPPTMPPQPTASAPIPGYNQALPPPTNTASAFLNAPPPPPEQDFQKFAQTNANRPPPPPQESNSPQTFKNQNINPSNDQKSGPPLSNQNNDKRNSFIEKDYNFNKNSSNQDNFKNQQGLNKGNNNQLFDRSSENQNKFGHSYDRSSENQTKFGQSYDRNSENQSKFGQSYDRSSENQSKFGQSYDRSPENQNKFGQPYDRGSENQNKFGQPYDRSSENQNKFGQNQRNYENQTQYNRSFENQQNQNQSRFFDNKRYEDNQMDYSFNEKSREEVLFDEQFKKWEEEFENWKRANVNHPDRKAYREYEMKFEECRRKLVERREQMRKRKLEQMQRNMPQTQNINAQYKDDNTTNYQQNKGDSFNSFNLPKQREEMVEDALEKERKREALEKEKLREALEKERLRESLEKERLRESIEKERLREALEKERLRESLEKERLKESLEKEKMRESLEKEMLRDSLEKERIRESLEKEKLKESLEKEETAEKIVVKIEEQQIDQDDRDESQEKTEKTSDEKSSKEEFLTSANSGGIPGLDLVDENKKIQKEKETNDEVEVIDLEKQGDEETSPKKINWERNETDLDMPQNPNNWMNQMSASQTKKIPSLFDMKIDKPPNFSPPSKSFEPEEELSEPKVNTTLNTTESSVINQQVLNAAGVTLPENITKALQDPSLLAILSTALKVNAFNKNDNTLNNSFINERMNVDDSNMSSHSRDMGNDRNQQNAQVWENQDNRRQQVQVWENQDNRRQQDWLQRPDTSFLKFGNDFSNNMNQRGRFDNIPNQSPWQNQNYDRNDNRGSNFYNDRRENERNRNSGGFGGRRYDDNDIDNYNDNYNRDNDRDNRFNPFKRDHNDSRDSYDGRRERNDSDQDRNQNNNRGRDRERDNRNDNSGVGNNRNRNDRDRNDRSRSNNRNNRFDDNKDEVSFNKNDKSSGGSSFNPFRRGESNTSSQGNNKNQPTPDEYFKPTPDEYFKPAQVIDYQNKPLKSSDNSSKEDFPLAKVVDYAHKATAKQIDYGHKSSSSNNNNNPKETKPNDDYFPMKTIEYGHSSNVDSHNKPPETKPQPEQKASSSFGGGFGDFLASKGLSGDIGGGNSNKVEDYKSPLNKMNSGITLNNPELQPKFGLKVFSTSNHGNNYNLNSNRGIFNTNRNKDSSFANANISSKYDFNNFENKNNKGFNISITDVDEISDGDDDEKCFSEPKNSASTPTNVNISTSFSAYVDNCTTKRYNINENEMKVIPPPPPLISTNDMLELSSSLLINKPTYSYNNFNQNDNFNHFNQNTFSNSTPCSTGSISTITNFKQIIFPSMENHNTITIDEILLKPGRDSRPKKLVIILRGPPGSGKSYLAKLIKEKEIEMKGTQPRILSIDDYFMNEVDKEERCPKTNRKIIKQELFYEFDKDMELKYIECLIKSFKKTLSEGLFNFVIVDCHNHSLRTFTEFYNIAKAENFTPYTIDLKCELEKCLENNIHKRDPNEIENIIKTWQETPEHYIKLDIESLIKEIDIQEVEMEDAFDNISNPEPEETSQQSSNNGNDEFDNDDENNVNESFKNIIKSKWDDTTEERLARLDGISKKLSKHNTIENYLQMDGWEPPSSRSNNKKRVRWADIEEKQAQDKMRAIGFVVGHTDWNRMMDPTGGSSALTKTKYIERINKSALRK